MMKRFSTMAIVAMALSSVLCAAGNKLVIDEWTVPWDATRPRDPAVDREGQVWFVGQTGDYIGVLDPRSGTFRRHELEKGSGPHNLIVGKDGAIWFAGNRKGYVGRLDPKSGAIRKFEMPNATVRDPHTLVLDASGKVWFSAQVSNHVGRLDPLSGSIDLLEVPTPSSRPYGIVVDAKQRVWFNEFGTNKIGWVDPKTLQIREVLLPQKGSRSRRIAIAADGNVWYVDYALGRLGRLEPESGSIREWQTPGGAGSLPYAMAVDDRNRVWFVETGPQPNQLVGFDASRETFLESTPIPSGGSTVRHMIFHPPTRELWFGTDKNTIGRAKVP
ncbi:MAG TPA: lyase [Thermoanaerobaculia bacterium]|nr:lyase [Thermoanaerobaculia bacterium]